MSWAAVLVVCSLAVFAYVYVAYPLLLKLIVRLRGVRVVKQGEHTSSLTLVISAFNEEAVIRSKLENALSLEYSGPLEVVVVSDSSTDATDAIVREFEHRGVRLMRQPERRGKTAGLNRTVPQLSSEIVVFSDANALYATDALLKLARNFADPEVGCVTGEARYLASGDAAADRGERVYWNYEMWVKRLETALGSMVGGDGAIYAIRRSLWRQLPENAINDFLNPLQIVASGWRGVYEPEAVCYEETAGAVYSEYRRRVRIVSRSWRAVFLVSEVLNPFRVGLFAWCVISHKVLRWLSGASIVTGAAGVVWLAVTADSRLPVVAAGSAMLLGLAMTLVPGGRRALSMTGYFAVINAASLVGVVKGSFGSVSGIWTTPRSPVSRRSPAAFIPVGRLFIVFIALMLAASVLAVANMDSTTAATAVFWSAAAVLGYVYVGYPAILAFFRLWARRPVAKDDRYQPQVCLFIAANDEEDVIGQKLQNALTLNYPAERLHILVASDGSVDRTNAIVRGFAPRVELLPLSPRRGKIAAIIEGMRRVVTSDIVIFSDANTFLERDAVSALVRNFADPAVGGVSGDVALVGERAALGRSEDLYYRYEHWLQRAESEIGSMIGADGALYAIRRDLFAEPAIDTILDDMAIPMAIVRAGRRVVFEPAARAHEQGSETATEEFTRKSRVIAGAVQFLTRPDSTVSARNLQVVLSIVSHKALRWLSPAFAACMFVSSGVLAVGSQAYAFTTTALAIVVALGIAGCVPTLRRAGIIAVAHYFCLVQAAAFVGLVRGLTGRQSVLWRRFERMPVHEPIGAPR